VVRHVTYCRICPAICGLVLEIEDNRVTQLVGDRDNPLSQGYTCIKGRHIGDFHSDPGRLLDSQRRNAAGELEPVAVDDAVEEITARLQEIIRTYGPDSVALLTGTQAAMSSLTIPFTRAWFRNLGSQSLFSPQTVDQAAKWVAEGRLGAWGGGRQRFADSDVWLLVGTNPLVTMQGGDFTGFPVHNGSQRLAAEQRRGLKLLVVDPRQTEVAARADLHLQLIPGTDAQLFAGLLHVVLAEGLEDQEFCATWVSGLEDLKAAVAPFTPELVPAAWTRQT
jgi:anaerobic selenocysteine-containing dehydrogenase